MLSASFRIEFGTTNDMTASENRREITMTITNSNQLIENHKIAFLRADICLGSPESYSLDEKRQICEDMKAT